MIKSGYTLRFLVFVVYAIMLIPIAIVVWLAFSESSIMQFPPSSYSLKWFAELGNQTQMWNGFLYSIWLGAAAAIVATVLGTAAALATSGSSRRWVVILEGFFTGPLIIPGIVSGVALYIFLFQVATLTHLDLVPSFWSLLSAHVLITLPWAYRLIVAGLSGMPPNVERASLNLGSTNWGTWMRVTLPLLKPSLIGALILTFIFSFADLEISLFLVSPGATTLPIAMVEYTYWRIDPVVAAMATIQVLLIGLLLLVSTRVLELRKVLTNAAR